MNANARDKPEWNEDEPRPGSDEALDRGCTCPVLDNAHGKGRMVVVSTNTTDPPERDCEACTGTGRRG